MPTRIYVYMILPETKGEKFKLIDTPGGPLFQERRNEEIRDAIRKGYQGIINIVAYGYHEGKQDPEYVFDQTGGIREDYLAEKRQNEIDMLNEWTTLLGGSEAKAFLITLVNKADLWGTQRNRVLEYYNTGRYAESLGEARHLDHIVLPYCSIQDGFYGKEMGYIRDPERTKLRENLLIQLFNAISGLPFSDAVSHYPHPDPNVPGSLNPTPDKDQSEMKFATIGSHRGELEEVLTHVYGTHTSLFRDVQIKFNKNLDIIAGNNFQAVHINLITWAVKNGVALELMSMLLENAPQNPYVVDFFNKHPDYLAGISPLNGQ